MQKLYNYLGYFTINMKITSTIDQQSIIELFTEPLQTQILDLSLKHLIQRQWFRARALGGNVGKKLNMFCGF